MFRPNPTAATTDAGRRSNSGAPPAGSVIMPGNRNTSSNANTESATFPGSSPGHTLGGSSANRRVTDARAARLQALEGRGEHAV